MREFSKIIVAFLLINSIVWIYASYYLAFVGRTQIAETLSKTIVVEVLGVIAIYAIKALFENLSKHNVWPDKPKQTECGGVDTDAGNRNEYKV